MLICPAFGNGQNNSDRGIKSTLACVYAGSLKKKKSARFYSRSWNKENGAVFFRIQIAFVSEKRLNNLL